MDPSFVEFGLQDPLQPAVFAQLASFFQAEQFFVIENCDQFVVPVAISRELPKPRAFWFSHDGKDCVYTGYGQCWRISKKKDGLP